MVGGAPDAVAESCVQPCPCCTVQAVMRHTLSPMACTTSTHSVWGSSRPGPTNVIMSPGPASLITSSRLAPCQVRAREQHRAGTQLRKHQDVTKMHDGTSSNIPCLQVSWQAFCALFSMFLWGCTHNKRPAAISSAGLLLWWSISVLVTVDLFLASTWWTLATSHPDHGSAPAPLGVGSSHLLAMSLPLPDTVCGSHETNTSSLSYGTSSSTNQANARLPPFAPLVALPCLLEVTLVANRTMISAENEPSSFSVVVTWHPVSWLFSSVRP